MCLSCGEHVAATLWYLRPKAHNSSGFIPDMLDRIMYQAVILPGLRAIKHRQPYGTERWTGVSRALMDWLTAVAGGFQVLPDMESAFKVIDIANEVGLTQCTCRKVLLDEGHDAPWRCLSLNNAARVLIKAGDYSGRIIKKDEAKALIVKERQKGRFQSVGWRFGANVTWICNCDEACGAHRTPELQWGMIPSFFISRMTPGRCTECGECLAWCQRNAIIVGVGATRIDETWCWGCGLCVEHCPQGALALYPRSRYHDVATRQIVELPPGKLGV